MITATWGKTLNLRNHSFEPLEVFGRYETQEKRYLTFFLADIFVVDLQVKSLKKHSKPWCVFFFLAFSSIFQNTLEMKWTASNEVFFIKHQSCSIVNGPLQSLGKLTKAIFRGSLDYNYLIMMSSHFCPPSLLL